MTRARQPRPHEVQAAARDPRFLSARSGSSDESWRTKGRCRTVDPETFFPLPTEPADMALALCRSCPVRSACLRAALETGDCEGVWGATTPRERRAMLVAWHEDSEISVGHTGAEPMLASTGAAFRTSSRGSTRSITHAPRHEPVVRSAYEERYSAVS
ncbi:MAG: WhiB family transcriptional regulator [Mycobacteriales bacterium]